MTSRAAQQTPLPVHAHLNTGLMQLLSPSPPAPPPPAEQKQESWIKPLVDLTVKEGKEKIAKFEGEFSKKESKPKWFFKKDVSIITSTTPFLLQLDESQYEIMKLNTKPHVCVGP